MQRELPEEDPRRPDQHVFFWLQQFRHGGPLRPSAPPPQKTQIQGMSSSNLQAFDLRKHTRKYPILMFTPLSSLQSLSGSLHNVTEDFSSMSISSSPSLSSSSCSSSQPDLSCSSLVLSPESSSSSCSSQAVLPVYNKQISDLCIIRVSVECVSNGNVYKSILVCSAVHCTCTLKVSQTDVG